LEILPIHLNTIDRVKDFVNCMNKIDGEVTISCGRYVINAKSIMGIFSLDLTKTLTLKIEEWKDEYAALVKRYEA
jgi:phosphotransferase system HPr-like phosphotransfer protein